MTELTNRITWGSGSLGDWQRRAQASQAWADRERQRVADRRPVRSALTTLGWSCAVAALIVGLWLVAT